MTLNEALEKLKALELKQYAFNFAMSSISLDAVTVAPKDTAPGRGKALGILSEEDYKILANPETGELLAFLDEERKKGNLPAQEAREVELLKRDYDQMSRIPMDEYVAYQVLLNDADDAWHKAKDASDFAMFEPYLEKIVAYNIKFAGYYDPEKAPYDALLNEFERGATMEMLDAYFAELRNEIVPLLKATREKPQVRCDFTSRPCAIPKQRELSEYVMGLMGLGKDHVAIGETEHPFTLHFNKNDVRITTHYFENAMVSSMFSVIHEGGHALYERGVDDCYLYTRLASGVSMGVHESQSRFYENIVGRSRAFTGFLFPKLVELFPEAMEGVTPEEFYKAVNMAEPSLIRTEADELTYSLHVMVRYEIEKQLIGGTLAVKDVPATWNRLYKEYLGVDVPDDKHGCLQDSHWSGGAFGYFPSYSLGSAYGAQLLRVMEKDFDVWGEVAKGNLAPVTEWLRERIHRYGCLYNPTPLMEQAWGGKFDPTAYTEYLKQKYTDIYDL